MAASFQSDMSLDDVTVLVNRFGDQFLDTCYVSGSLAIKDKAPLTVPSAFTYKKKLRLTSANATPSSACLAQPQRRPDYHEVSGAAPLALSLRYGIKCLLSTNKVDALHDGSVRFGAFLCALSCVEAYYFVN